MYGLINCEIRIEQYTKTEENSWLFRAYESDTEKIVFNSINGEIVIADIYGNVSFSLSYL